MSISGNNTTSNDISGISDDTISKCNNDSAIIPAATAASHPKASYDDVVADSGLFMETLKDLHSSLNSKFLVPTIGRKLLDLHRLFVEVTQRGGFEKVTSERKWRELSSMFDFASTATNASHLLRKNYVRILQKYELVYFFKESPKLSPKDESNTNSELSANIANMYQNSTHQIPNVNNIMVELPNANIASMHQVKSTRQISNEGTDSFVLSDANIANVYRVNSNGQQTSVSTPRKRKRKESDFHANVATGFNAFFVEHYSNMRPLYSGKEKAMIKQINLLWSNLSESEKEVYRAREKARCRNI